MTQSREAVARDRFREIAAALSLEVMECPPKLWFNVTSVDDTLHRPLGFLPEYNGELRFCPAVTVLGTDKLDDAMFAAYLDTVELHLYEHRRLHGAPDIEAAIDNAIYEHSPDSVALLSQVHLRALDRLQRAIWA